VEPPWASGPVHLDEYDGGVSGPAGDARREREEGELDGEDHAECPFAPDEPVDRILDEVVADRVLLKLGAAELPDTPVGECHGKGPDMPAGVAVLEGTSAGGVAGHRTTDGAVLFAGRVEG
jgi:hypothetical protein